jgi:glycosyltransferase involved in cell wall biosynthesis
LLKVRPAVIHNINSTAGWEIFGRYGTALKSESRLFVSVFCFDYSREGEPLGLARKLPAVHRHVSGIFSDNRAFVSQLVKTYGFDPAMFVVLNYPIEVDPRFKYVTDERPKILWAGRLDRQKRPDVLAAIAKSLPEHTFHVYGTMLLEQAPKHAGHVDELRRLPNVVMLDAYDSFETIPPDNYALFLYTSQWDGLPNVILEALGSGLPVVAPNVGGVEEVIPPDSGFLIERYDDIEAYARTIRTLLAKPELLSRERETRLMDMRQTRSYEQFANALENTPGYVRAASPIHVRG